MDLALSLGETPKTLKFLEKAQKKKKSMGFCMGLEGPEHIIKGNSRSEILVGEEEEEKSGSSDPPVQLDLLPSTPVQHNIQPLSQSHLPFPWLTPNLLGEPGSSDRPETEVGVKRGRWSATEDGEDGAVQSSPNSTVSTLIQMDIPHYLSNIVYTSDQRSGGHQVSNSRASTDEEEIINGLNRKKLRLSKEQSAFLEESFKEHTTLNPKQKLALAKQLNLRPRQVEVWFQNRRARTKLKQTEVDCEYLKTWCETLTDENRRLQKEVQDLRALKTSQPFYMQHPATTLTMCPSCERVASATSSAATAATAKPRSCPSTTTSKTQVQAQDQRTGSLDQAKTTM
ncbi:homeobox-leucine zipper protein HOX11-like [Rhododendron vialii]|uniref:homeobox-leucine zipper protein HOX11-like n=1 Tax=Rhododendron vialii TaxID=182163 RepID=UPI00265EAFB4|nr:homeobox-leucine zipper protein HOX11-like [Rhododendron vialii]